MQLIPDAPFPGPPGSAHPPTVPPAAASTTPSPAANALSPEDLLALLNAQPDVNGAALPSVAGRLVNTTLAGAVANPAYPFSMQFVPGAPLPGSPGTAFPRNGSPAAASTPSPAASAVSSDALVAAMLASAQLAASGAGSPFSPFSSPPPQTPVLPVGANGLELPLYQLMQALEQAQAMVTQLAAGGNASLIPATTPPPRALEDALVTSATLMADATLTDARNAAGPFVCGESSSLAWTSKKRSVGQRDTASTDLLAAIPDDQVEGVRRLIVNGGAVAEIGKILRGCKVPYEVRRDLLETVLRVHLVTNPHGQRGPWSAAEFDSVVTLLSSLPGKPVWTDHNLVHDVAQRCFDRDQLRAIFRPLLPTTPTSSTATPASSAATALRLALVTPDKSGRMSAHVAAYCVNVEFLVLVGQVYPMALAQLNAMTKASFLHSLAGRDGAAGALQRLRDELPPWLIEQAVTAVDTYGCTPLAMAEYQAKVRKRDEVWPTVKMLSEMVAAMQVA